MIVSYLKLTCIPMLVQMLVVDLMEDMYWSPYRSQAGNIFLHTKNNIHTIIMIFIRMCHNSSKIRPSILENKQLLSDFYHRSMALSNVPPIICFQN